ncbi:hypothetical protein LPB140_07615 [Sphingorhabdus lutea]|uniref:Carboxypeptidase regulatory-like domain-containing protein n=1 Tax=Sphingorhabdus lutea TaxID=1913578 RepID=A0A1L3JC54_9SPHN|nr:hypothetical protein LPB140_07615 [Sphingorhabdus lutea]
MDQAEALLDNNDKICVRAQISPLGVIRTLDGTKNKSRRFVAAVGASLSLATAACQTTASPNVTPRYEINGRFNSYWQSNAYLTSDSGKSYSFKIYKDGKFRFTNLRAGTYNLSFTGSCGEKTDIGPILVNEDIMLGEVKDMGDDNSCIIIGVMVRQNKFALNGKIKSGT